MATLGQYRLQVVGALSVGGPGTTSLTFAQLGVVAAQVVIANGGRDYAEITIDRSIYHEGMPFAPLKQHNIYGPDGVLRFTGWLIQPARTAPSSAQQRQTFRFEGPMHWLEGIVYRTPWRFYDPEHATVGVLADRLVPRCILHRALKDEVPEVYRDGSPNVDGAPIRLRRQIQILLEHAINPPSEPEDGFDAYRTAAPIAYAGLSAIDSGLQPPEDEQYDQTVGALLARELRWVPEVSVYWKYTGAHPTLQFVNDSTGGSHAIHLRTARLASFSSQPRYDLLVRKVRLEWISDALVTLPDGTPYARRQVEESVAENGSDKVIWQTIDLRGQSGRTDGGVPAIKQEPVPGSLTPGGTLVPGLAARLHTPCKVLHHTLQWSRVAADVDWSLTPGMVVTVTGGGDPLLGPAEGSGAATISLLAQGRSVLQTITRDLATGTTSCEAGPRSFLGLNDLRSLMRHGATRNAGRGGSIG